LHSDDRARRALERLNRTIVRCRLCPRLVRHREAVAAEPPRRYQGQKYWARPLPGFGDPRARLVLVGLAPAANGGNRTGRMFTGDMSGTWLARALFETGFASKPTSEHRDDGLRLRDAYITAAVRCAPPDNKPTPAEMARCAPYLELELRLLTRLRVVVALGRVGWQAYLRVRRTAGAPAPLETPVFGHGSLTRFPDGVTLIASYHPSQQNTFTGKLTAPMLRAVFARARSILDSEGGFAPLPTLRGPSARSAASPQEGLRRRSRRSKRPPGAPGGPKTRA
jgi:uracil-DNA glycosylase family 4